MDPKLTTRGSQRQIHAASLIDRSLHSQVLLQLLNITAGANQPGVVGKCLTLNAPYNGVTHQTFFRICCQRCDRYS